MHGDVHNPNATVPILLRQRVRFAAGFLHTPNAVDEVQCTLPTICPLAMTWPCHRGLFHERHQGQVGGHERQPLNESPMWAGHGEGGHGCDFHGSSTSLRSIVSDLGGNMAHNVAAPTLLGLLVGGVWQWQIQPSLSYGVPNPVQASCFC